MSIIDRQWRVVLIALVATACAIGVVRAGAQGQGDAARAVPLLTAAGMK